MSKQGGNLPSRPRRFKYGLSLDRRHALLLGGSALTFVFPHVASADAEFQIQASPQQNDASNLDKAGQSHGEPSTGASEKAEKAPPPSADANIGSQLGISSRAPTIHKVFSATHLRETSTSQIPAALSTKLVNHFFVDHSNRRLSTPGGAPLYTALRKAAPQTLGRMQPQANVLETERSGSPQDKESDVNKFLSSIEWEELIKSTWERTADLLEGEVKDDFAEHILKHVGLTTLLPLYKAASLLHDALSPTDINGGKKEELDYMDTLSPVERREFLSDVFRYSPSQENASFGRPILHNAD